MQIGERIRRWRESKPGLTQVALARRLKISRAAVSYWEMGKCQPTHKHLGAVARVLGVSLSRFWDEPPKPKTS